MVAALVVANRSPVTPREVVPDAAAAAAVPAPVEPLPGAPAVANTARDSRAVTASPRVDRVGVGRPPRQQVIVAAPVLAAGPDMTVVTSQGALLRAAWQRVPAVGVAVAEPAPAPAPAAAAVPTPPDPVAAPIVVSEIKIDPIVFLRLDSPVAPSGSPAGGVRKVIADDSARSKE
jgi:hypothetical protein